MNDASRILRDPKLARLLSALATTGRESRVVGGAVRDTLLGIEPHEIDIATAALPEAVARAARDAGLKAVPTGLAHGTVTVVVEGTPFEVTTLREDVETFGRAAKVRFGADFEQDALRRDFTVNAMSLSPDGRLHDYTGGRADLAQRKIRFIGDPATRIAEDYLRVLRFFRFHAAIGEGPLDPLGLRAAILARENLVALSRERIRGELLKLLVARRAPATILEMSQAGVIEILLGMTFPARLERFIAIEATRGVAPDPIARLAALAVVVREDAERLRERLRLSNAEHARIALAATLIEGLRGHEGGFARQELNTLLFLHGRDGAADALALLHAEGTAAPDDARWRDSMKFVSEAEAPAFPIKGADLVARGVAPGRALGAALKRLQANWIRAGFPRDPRRVLQLLEDVAPNGEN
jgi:poly(A) polymerase